MKRKRKEEGVCVVTYHCIFSAGFAFFFFKSAVHAKEASRAMNLRLKTEACKIFGLTKGPFAKKLTNILLSNSRIEKIDSDLSLLFRRL